MAVQDTAPQTDKDLTSIAEARSLARAARQAQPLLAELSQDQIDRIVSMMAEAVTAHAEALAQLAVEETTYGVVAAIVPSTNPTSTAIYKVLISLKARCPIVISPHPSAARCITRTVEIMAEAAQRAGAPTGSIGWMKTVTLEGTQELMKQREVAVILATGGMGLVRAAYSAGKPAYGVGPGNAPCYIEGSADLDKAASDIVLGKTFDFGVLCSSPNSVVVDESVADESRRRFEARGAYFLNQAEMDLLAKVLVSPQRLPNPALVGKSALFIAGKAGISAPAGTTVLIAPLTGVGRDYPLSIEKLCPVLSWYVVKDWREGCERCIQILRYGGMGHTMSIHSKNDDVILQFGLKKPAFRICVNTPTTHGSIGLTTGLDPAMTLGCGGWGGNITSDNISPRHLLNIKRLAYEVRPAVVSPAKSTRNQEPAVRLPTAPAPPVSTGISAQALSSRVDAFLSSRGFRPGESAPPDSPKEAQPKPLTADNPRDFICEDDVRDALKSGKTLVVGERTIVTPSARELGEANKVFVQAGYPR